jgi:hypothetical protein
LSFLNQIVAVMVIVAAFLTVLLEVRFGGYLPGSPQTVRILLGSSLIQCMSAYILFLSIQSILGIAIQTREIRGG